MDKLLSFLFKLCAALPALTALTCLTAVNATASESTLYKITLQYFDSTSAAARFSAQGFDVLEGSITDSSFDVIVSETEYAELTQRSLPIIKMERGRPLRDIVAMGGPSRDLPAGYLDLAGINQHMIGVAAAYPSIAIFVNLTQTYNMPQTFEGRDMFALKISDNVALEEDEPSLMIVSNHHAREIVTPVIAMDAMDRLTSGYGVDSAITNAVNDYEIWIAANWNPDGYNEVVEGDNFWRKNRRVFPSGTGVDQNRNYPQGWNSSCDGSTLPSSQTYKGPSPASEPETQTMMAWSQDQRFAKVIDYHSSGREVLYSYSCSSHPFTTYYRDEADELSVASGYFGNIRPAGAEGEHYQWQFAQQGAWSHLIETATTFQPSYTSAQTESDRVWPGILHAINRPIPLTGVVRDAFTEIPVAANIELAGVNFSEGESNNSGGLYGRYYVFAPAGTYSVTFSAEGYTTQTVSIELQAGQATLQNIDLIGDGPDTDSDGVPDAVDNCLSTSNTNQIDADQDGYGNLCDADFNNDCVTNFIDIAELADGFLGVDAELDLNSDGAVNFIDFALIPDLFLQAPGPSNASDLCPPVE